MNAILAIIFLILYLFPVPIYAWLLRRSRMAGYIFLALVVLEGVFLAFFTVLNFGGAFGPGMFFCGGRSWQRRSAFY